MNDYEIQKIRDTSFCSGYNTAVSKYENKIADLEAKLKHAEENCIKKTCVVFKDKEDCVAKLLELEKENAELKEKLKTAYRKGMRHMAKALKDYDRTDGAWTDYFEHTVDKVLQREQLDFEEYGTLADQLTKAKRIIQEFLDLNYSEFTKTNAVFLHADKFLKESK